MTAGIFRLHPPTVVGHGGMTPEGELGDESAKTAQPLMYISYKTLYKIGVDPQQMMKEKTPTCTCDVYDPNLSHRWEWSRRTRPGRGRCGQASCRGCSGQPGKKKAIRGMRARGLHFPNAGRSLRSPPPLPKQAVGVPWVHRAAWRTREEGMEMKSKTGTRAMHGD